MSVFVGQVLVYLKIGLIAFSIMGVVWVVIRVVEAKGKRAENRADTTNRGK